MHSVEPTKSFIHKCLVKLETNQELYEIVSGTLSSHVPLDNINVEYTFAPTEEDPEFYSLSHVSIYPTLPKVVMFDPADVHTHYAVLYRVWAILTLIENFLNIGDEPVIYDVDDESVSYDDGWGTITLTRGEKETDVVISYLDKWTKCIPFDKYMVLWEGFDYRGELLELLIQLKEDGYKAQEEMLKRDGSLDKFIFHVYPSTGVVWWGKSNFPQDF